VSAPGRVPRAPGLRLYRALLRLYPAGFLADYRSELAAVFAERARALDGPLVAPRAWWMAAADVVPNALAVHADMLRQDVRYAARSLARAPGFALTVVLLVALGVGANTAAFSLADFVLVRPLPFPEPGRLVKVWQGGPEFGRNEISPAQYRDWAAEAASSLAGFGALTRGAANLVGAEEPRRLQTARVTPGLLPLVGVPALLGRAIAPADSADPAVVVLSHALWRSQFRGAPRPWGA
jgi:putative ABC transport system permease protein